MRIYAEAALERMSRYVAKAPKGIQLPLQCQVSRPPSFPPAFVLAANSIDRLTVLASLRRSSTVDLPNGLPRSASRSPVRSIADTMSRRTTQTRRTSPPIRTFVSTLITSNSGTTLLTASDSPLPASTQAPSVDSSSRTVFACSPPPHRSETPVRRPSRRTRRRIRWRSIKHQSPPRKNPATSANSPT